MIQEGRLFSLQTSLGPDVLLLESFTGREAMSHLFRFELEMVSEEEDIKPVDIVGKLVKFELQSQAGEPRVFNGHISRFSAGERADSGFRRYRATVVPWLWFLTKTSDCRVFQGKNAVEIAEQIFGEYGFSDYDASNVRTAPPSLPYCVQYRETDFNFLSRLWEDAGIFYFFRHDGDRHVLVLADSTAAYQDCPEHEVRCVPGSLTGNHIYRWEHQYEFVSGQHTNLDYNYETPSTRLMSQVPTVLDLPDAPKWEIYDFPGEYPDKSQGDAKTQVRMEEEEAAFHVVEAESNCVTFCVGGKFLLKDHDRCPSENGKAYSILSISHAAVDPSFAYEGAKTARYSNTFLCTPEKVVFRPPRTSVKPFVHGPQTALVVGPSGEEIYTDDQGRVKVQFHWDREGKKDEKSSCWIRVAQNWAGKTWGSFFLPRIGQEVVVHFMEGDPDCPLVTGGVYNPEQMPPVSLPGSKTQTTIKTRSTKGGGPANFNEIRFEDKKGGEELYIHAEKDNTFIVENDRNKNVGHDESSSIGNNRTEKVGVDEKITIGSNRTEKVGADEKVDIGANRTKTVGSNDTLTVGANQSRTISGNRDDKVSGNETRSVSGDRTRSVSGSESVTVSLQRTHKVGINETIGVGVAQEITVGAEQTVKVGANQTITVGADQSTSVGANQTNSITAGRKSTVGEDDQLDVTKKLTITAGEEISITTGKASIVLKKDGTITINGKDITIDGSGEITAKAAKDFTLKGQKILQN